MNNGHFENGGEKTLHLEINRKKDRLKISVREGFKNEERTIRHYEEISTPIKQIEDRCVDLVKILNNANSKGMLPSEAFKRLKGIGQTLYDQLFTLDIKEKLKHTSARYLYLSLDDQLVHIPWELLNDGREFLCQRFNMGRLVRTRLKFPGASNSGLTRPLSMLLLADPTQDLKDAYNEGKELLDLIDRYSSLVNVTLHTDNITPAGIREIIRNYDLVHFAGHCDYGTQSVELCGWRFQQGNLTPSDIIKMAGTSIMPSLVFSNSCQSARTQPWRLSEALETNYSGMANAFLLAGVKHYIGTLWEISDEYSRHFAVEFYQGLLNCRTIGDSLRHARQKLIDNYGEKTIVWASYCLYGDPAFNYLGQINQQPEVKRQNPTEVFHSKETVRHLKESINTSFEEQDQARSIKAGKNRKVTVVALVLVLLSAFVFFAYRGFNWWQTGNLEKKAILSYTAGKYPEAINYLGRVEHVSPDSRKIRLLMNEILEKIDFVNNQKKEARIDRLVKELTARAEQNPEPANQDGWTSKRLTVWVMDFQTTGYTLHGGKDKLVHASLINGLIKRSRAQIVERTLLEKLMEELHLGSSKIVDRETINFLGKLLAARVILFNRIIYSGQQTKLSIRCIETETGQVKAVVIQTFDGETPAAIIGEKIVDDLVEKLNGSFPLRAKVAEQNGDFLILNIGKNQGVDIGRIFKAIDSEAIIKVISTDQNISKALSQTKQATIQPGTAMEAVY